MTHDEILKAATTVKELRLLQDALGKLDAPIEMRKAWDGAGEFADISELAQDYHGFVTAEAATALRDAMKAECARRIAALEAELAPPAITVANIGSVLARMRANEWHSGPPPHVGWWNASASKTPDVWRWWNGESWSWVAKEGNSPWEVAHVAQKLTTRPGIEWTHYWPENARVPRVTP